MSNIVEWLNNKLNTYAYEQGSDVLFHVYDERDFEDTSIKGRLKENEIAVVVSALPNELSYYVEVKPFSVYCLLTDAVDFSTALELIRGFSTAYNFTNEISSYQDESLNVYKKVIKYQLEQPQIAQDFTYYGNDYASVAILGLTQTIIDKVAELTCAALSSGAVVQGDQYGLSYIYEDEMHSITNEIILPLSFSCVLTSSTNTETFASNDMGQSIITASTLTLSFSIPAISNALTGKLYKQFLTTGTTRNDAYRLVFYLNGNKIDGNFKLVNMKYDTAPDGSPVIALGFTL